MFHFVFCAVGFTCFTLFLLLISRVPLLFCTVGFTCFIKCFVFLDVRVSLYVMCCWIDVFHIVLCCWIHVFHFIFCAAGFAYFTLCSVLLIHLFHFVLCCWILVFHICFVLLDARVSLYILCC